jgi:anti-sigma regulatory factor (Ser/Thr protein kinase)
MRQVAPRLRPAAAALWPTGARARCPQYRDIDAGCDGMRSGAACGHAGHFHEAGFYGGDAEFRSLIVPFAEEGIAAGEPVIIGYDDRKSGLLRSWLTDPSAVEFIADNSLYATPARAIATYQRLFEFHLAMGAGQIRIAGDVPHAGNGGRFEGWDRYECALNTVWQDFPVWGLCLYDTATAPAVVLDAVERTHPRLVSSSGGRRLSGRYQGVSEFQTLAVAPDPLEQTAPVIEQTDSSAAGVRRALTQVGRGRVPGAVLDDLLLGTSEAVNNAVLYGDPPVTVRIWAGPGRIVVCVHDRGVGPANPLAGLTLPAGNLADAELGLWLTHQLGIDVALIYGDDGFTVRLRTGPISA